ncbi:hypothetical protein ANCDUO_00392 [Ancylostoma duodenale]|uniref:Uncharacterized protein n=1 Tax=Ancylostoma duodenale TaxID=51022 RepID=A0A0C2H5X7_9BILA|nr:hypothetical protein ANCDUO_00392 [Ancylostoma duodenale]
MFKIFQVLLELSIFYQPQNVYCITVDQGASKIYKKFVNNLPKCFKNINTFVRRLTSWSCVFGVMDMPEVVKRPELVAHKMYLDTEPAAFICLLKEIRRRSRHPVEFDAQSYAEMPTVELSSGKRITELTHPEWLMRSSFYRPPSQLVPMQNV